MLRLPTPARPILGDAPRRDRHAPFVQASGRLKRLIRLGWKHFRVLNRDRIVKTTINGITYELHLDETIDSEIYYAGCFEATTTEAIGRLCRLGMVVLDVGANVVGSAGRVIAFEPMPWANQKIRNNLSLHQLQNVSVENIGLSDEALHCHGALSFQLSLEREAFAEPESENHTLWT
jgi:hypothetical protein